MRSKRCTALALVSLLTIAAAFGAASEPRQTKAVGGWGTLETVGSGSDQISLVKVGGTRYQMGYHYGELLAAQIDTLATNFSSMATEAEFSAAISALWSSSYFSTSSWEQELQGIADGCAAAGHPGVTLQRLLQVHVIPDLSEYNCGLFAAWGDATADGHQYQLRNLDWSMDTGAQDYPVVTMFYPDDGVAHALVGFAGLVGAAVGGINAHGIALSEIMGGFGDAETLSGIPYPVLLRDILYNDTTLAQALSRMQNATRTNQYYYCITGPDSLGDPDARLLFTSHTRFDAFGGGANPLPHPNYSPFYEPLDDVVYWKRHDGGAYAMPDGTEDARKGNQTLYAAIESRYGSIDAEKAKEIAVADGVDGTVVSIVYDTTDLKFWVAFAEGATTPATSRSYVEFQLDTSSPQEGEGEGQGEGQTVEEGEEVEEGEGEVAGGGTGYRTSVGSGTEEIPLIVVAGTPYEMGYQYGQLMQSEVQAFVSSFLAYVRSEEPDLTDAMLDAAWNTTAPYTDDRYEEEIQGLADGAGISLNDARRTHAVTILGSYSCSSIAAWDTATADGHLYQTRDLDWDMGAHAHDYPVIVVYLPEDGIPPRQHCFLRLGRIAHRHQCGGHCPGGNGRLPKFRNALQPRGHTFHAPVPQYPLRRGQSHGSALHSR